MSCLKIYPTTIKTDLDVTLFEPPLCDRMYASPILVLATAISLVAAVPQPSATAPPPTPVRYQRDVLSSASSLFSSATGAVASALPSKATNIVCAVWC
jgi:hypothetical protein